jgi:plasmid stabilization system protein ParE
MKRYRLARRARADLDRIWVRIARDVGIKSADRFVDRVIHGMRDQRKAWTEDDG